MVKIGAELPKLFQIIKLGIRFLDHPIYHYYTLSVEKMALYKFCECVSWFRVSNWAC